MVLKLSSQSFDTVTGCLLLHHTRDKSRLSMHQWDSHDIAAAAGNQFQSVAAPALHWSDVMWGMITCTCPQVTLTYTLHNRHYKEASLLLCPITINVCNLRFSTLPVRAQVL